MTKSQDKNPELIMDVTPMRSNRDKESPSGNGDVLLIPNPRLWPITGVTIEGTNFPKEGKKVSASEVDHFTSFKGDGGLQLLVRG